MSALAPGGRMQSPGKAVDGSRSESWFAVVAADGWLVDGWRRVQAEDAERHAAWCDRNLSRGAPHSVIQVTQTTSIRYDAPPPAAPAVSPEPERDGPLNAYEDTDGPSGEDAVRERQYERDHGIEP